MKAWDKRGDRVFVEHRYTRDRNESLYGDLILKLHERVSMFGEYERDVKEDETVLYGLGFLYMSSCWSLDLGYSRDEDDVQYAVSINLYGLGTLGKKICGAGDRKSFRIPLNIIRIAASPILRLETRRFSQYD